VCSDIVAAFELPNVMRHHPHDRRNWLRQTPVLLVCATLTAYFAFHILHGRHGLEARNRLIERSSLLEFEIRSLEAVRLKLVRDVSLLRPELPDADLVEEIARETLGYVHPGDVLLPAD
jgi:cell division protein FtsB